MLTQNLSLDDASGDEIAFNLQTYTAEGARRIDITTSPTEARTLEIRHSQSGKDASAVDRHNVVASKTTLDGAGVPRKGSVSLTFTSPRSTAMPNTELLDLLAVIIDLVADGGFSGSGLAGTTNASAILRGES